MEQSKTNFISHDHCKKQDDDDMPISIRIRGHTYDICDCIKQYGAVWKGELKAWEVD